MKKYIFIHFYMESRRYHDSTLLKRSLGLRDIITSQQNIQKYKNELEDSKDWK